MILNIIPYSKCGWGDRKCDRLNTRDLKPGAVAESMKTTTVANSTSGACINVDGSTGINF